VRKHGLTIDHLLGAEVVTADGRVLEVGSGSHPDLFWAIRGGGGNFGVVTRFDYRLHPVDMVTGGMLALPATPETIAGLVAEAEAAPEELSVIANILLAPPLPFVPQELVGKPLLLMLLVHAGPLDDGMQAIAPLRALASPVADFVRAMPFSEMFTAEAQDVPPRAARGSRMPQLCSVEERMPRTSTSSATRAQSVSGPPIPASRGTASPRSSAATTRRTCSG
jgi:FAD/FMN-containing dehydrogenase